MNLRFIIPGKDKKDFISEGIKDYILKIKKYSKVSLEYVNETTINNINEKEIKTALDKDATNILKIISDKEYVILLDIHAKDISTSSLSNKINDIVSSNGNITFVIGSSYGVSDLLRKRSNYSFSLSRLTFTHYMSLLLTLEQVYCCFKINNNEIYDK